MLHVLCSALMVCALLCLPCRSDAAERTGPLPVLVSIAPQKFMVERIAGNAVSVTVLVKAGADPHTYEPSPSQIRAGGAARIWFTIGVPFEDIWLPRITGSAPGLATVSLISGIRRLKNGTGGREHAHTGEEAAAHSDPPEEKDDHAHSHAGEDPHVWLSPMLAREMLPVITRTLCRELPDQAALFRANAKALDAELEALDTELALAFRSVPAEKRVFLTFHPSWRYFAHTYQLTELSIEADGKEPGPKKLQDIINIAKAHGITTIFVEPQFPRNAARAIAETLHADIVEADPLLEDLLALYMEMGSKLIRSFQR